MEHPIQKKKKNVGIIILLRSDWINKFCLLL